MARKRSITERSRRGNATALSHPRRPVPDPTFTDRPYTDEESEWLRAVEAYQVKYDRRFPTNCELLAVLKSLGYRKVSA